MARFSDEQIRRYSRQILLREVGGQGQARFLAARPVLLCAGAVGEVAAEYLWRAGVTELTLLASTSALAAQLGDRLFSSGYPGRSAQALSPSSAPSDAWSLAQEAPGFSLLWLSGEGSTPPADSAALLWAGCCGAVGWVGQGRAALRAIICSRPAEVVAAASAGAMVVGSALALLALQRLAGLAGPPGDTPARPGAVWKFDLDSPLLPQWCQTS